MRLLTTLLALLLSSQVLAAEYFLNEEERAKLAPHPEVPGVINYWYPGVDLGSINNVLLGSVTLYFDDDSKYKEIDANEAKQISDAMRAAMVEAATGKVNIVSEPGPSTALLNVAITEIKLDKKKRGLLGYTPVGLVVTTAADLAGMRMELKNAKIEGEMVDAVTGDMLAIFRVENIPKEKGADSRTWNDVTRVFEDLMGKGIIAAKE